MKIDSPCFKNLLFHRTFIGLILGLTILTSVYALVADSESEPPNIIIILADDLGWKDVGFNGGVIATPNIDRIAHEGVRLNRFYVAPVCTPTRAGLMTGRYPIRYGLMRGVVMGYHDFGLDPDETIIPQVLAEAGYEHRGIFGKWHLGHSKPGYHPMQRGYTKFAGHLNAAIDYFSHKWLGEVDWFHDYEHSSEEGYATDLITKHAVQFVNDHAKDDAPFFMYVPYNAPHAPFQAKDDDLPLYQHLEGIPTESVVGENVSPDRYNWLAGHATGRTKLEDSEARLKDRRITGAMIHSLDQGVGQILDALDASNISDNTLVWFISDNGGDPAIGDNRPFRGAKGSVFEGGIRVAAAARWPAGGIDEGREVDAALNFLDVMPTLMEVSGVSENFDLELDGKNVMPALRGNPHANDREYFSFCGQLSDEREHVTAMEGDWKLIIIGPPLTMPESLGTSERLLFNLAADPSEQHDLATDYPKITSELTEKAVRFRALQPQNHVPLLWTGRDDFAAPPNWKLPEMP